MSLRVTLASAMPSIWEFFTQRRATLKDFSALEHQLGFRRLTDTKVIRKPQTSFINALTVHTFWLRTRIRLGIRP